jgi:hypothetical protein
MSDGVEVIRIEDAGSPDVVPIRKNARGDYVVEVVYVLVTGRRVLGTKSRRLLREAKALRATLPKVPERPLAALLADKTTEYVKAGDFIGTRETFGIGRRA